MSSLSSSVLLLAEPQVPHLHIEVDTFSRLTEVTRQLRDPFYDVVVLPLSVALSEDFQKLIRLIKIKNPWTQLVITAPRPASTSDLQKAINTLPVFKILESVAEPQFELLLVQALEQSQGVKQNIELENLVKDQNEKLRQLYNDLEGRVEKRQSFLLEAKKKTFVASTRWDAVRQAAMAIHQAQSIPEMERLLTEALTQSLQLSLIRIFFKPQDDMFTRQQRVHTRLSFFQAPLSRNDEQDPIGSVFFCRAAEKPFLRDEIDFLLRISELISLAIDRLAKLEQSETLKDQWEATFNAISDPVLILNKNYDIIQTNQAFLKKAVGEASPVIGKKCHQLLFGRNQPCQGCQLGKNFRIDGPRAKTATYDVHSQPLQLTPGADPVYVNQYLDITSQIRMEKKILESAKLAELGTIGSSIAHELNNPLGGMLSFVQLIKLDMPKSHPIYADIEAMEAGVRQCNDIVQNLLGFARDSSTEQEGPVDLREVIQRAVKIVELQSRSFGIEIKTQMPQQPAQVVGHLNVLTQAIQNLLQDSIQILMEKSRATKGFMGVIEMVLGQDPQSIHLVILDNGPGPEIPPGLGVSVAQQIIHEHKGILEFSQQPKQLRQAKISFSRPVFRD